MHAGGGVRRLSSESLIECRRMNPSQKEQGDRFDSLQPSGHGPQSNWTDRLVNAPSIHQPVIGNVAFGAAVDVDPAATNTGA